MFFNQGFDRSIRGNLDLVSNCWAEFDCNCIGFGCDEVYAVEGCPEGGYPLRFGC